MISIASSKSGVPIRLTDERWAHITEEHCELAGLRTEVLEAISHPERVFEGNRGESLAIRPLEPEKYLVAVYKESKEDGFVITAFLTRRLKSLEKRKQRWP